MKQRNFAPQLDGYAFSNPQYPVSDLAPYTLNSYVVGTGDLLTEPVFVGRLCDVSFTVAATGTPTGTFILEASNDLETREFEKSDSNITNWYAVNSGGDRIVSIAAAGSAITKQLLYPDCSERWLRVRYTHSSGSLTVSVRFNGKGRI